jgi:hypothetical protein
MFNRNLLMVSALGTLQLLNTGYASNAAPIFKNKMLPLTVITKDTKKPIVNSMVTINSDNGVRCITAPCPTNSMRWQGRTNRQGLVTIPHKVIQQSTTMTLPGYQPIQLQQNLRNQRGGVTIELLPVSP